MFMRCMFFTLCIIITVCHKAVDIRYIYKVEKVCPIWHEVEIFAYNYYACTLALYTLTHD